MRYCDPAPASSARSSRSEELFRAGLRVFPDGTTRVTVERDPTPLYVSGGEGAYLIDADGRRLLDLNNNYTTLIHGHRYAPVMQAVASQLERGTCFANPTEHEIALADLLLGRIPSADRIRFVNSGTEAVMFAIKAARAFTGKPGIARIEGAYHGAYDWAETGQGGTPSNWGPDECPEAVPLCHGVPETVAGDVTVLRFNDVEGAERRIATAADRLSCIVIDPMPSRAGLMAPAPEFIEMLQSSARKYGILILADEVLNFRQSYHGSVDRYGLVPDLIALGKIIGGGFPIGAIAGREEVMRVFGAPDIKPRLPQGGTFSANPVSMVAGYAAMNAMTVAEFARLEAMGERVRRGLAAIIHESECAFSVTGAASLFRIHPKSAPPSQFREAFMSPSETAVMNRLSRHFLNHGILLPVGAAACLSTAMDDEDVDKIVGCFEDFIAENATKN
ncbi:aspartate aminotransferase family protein [Aquamicrobium sp. LC103]|uniref:aspartate aminotransferase family protein n=1 Tax=Aquamicrobium sp. LC103 TaxID=1120658 RepID=UPI00063EACD1|nr:aspartate aminotransferase family protein [Aquamicrobium sp. LC103]TKT75658.1 aspartate aminotransferase family protein [Aquamicrobium sp. LC103]